MRRRVPVLIALLLALLLVLLSSSVMALGVGRCGRQQEGRKKDYGSHPKTHDNMGYLAPHTSGPRDVPRCGALSLLQKLLVTFG
jgi:hypothetical protein